MPPSNVLNPQRTFTCFSRLPVELRGFIWEYSCHVERNLDIWIAPFAISQSDKEEQPFKYITTTPAPAILHICKESRAAGLKHYDLKFEMEFTSGGSTHWTPNRIYANFGTDRVFLMGAWPEEALYDVAGYDIRKLAFSTQTMSDDDYSAYFFHRDLDEVLLFDSNHRIEETHGIEYTEVSLDSSDSRHCESFQETLSSMEADRWEEFEEEKKRVEEDGGSVKDVPVPVEKCVRVRTITID